MRCKEKNSVSLIGSSVVLVTIGLIVSACTGGEDRSQLEIRVDESTVVVSTESGLLGRPGEMKLDAAGTLHVLDGQTSQIHALSSTGELLRTVGSDGSGPREFRRPSTFALSDDTLRVVDMGNGRLQVFALNSDYQRSSTLPEGAFLGAGLIALRQDGSMIVATMGLEDMLAIHYDELGSRVGGFGSPLAPATGILNMRAMKAEIIAGTVPAFFRNSVLPVFDPGGDIWNACVDRASETLDNPRYISALSYVADVEVINSRIWLLLNLPEDEPSVMLGLLADGTIERRVEFSSVLGARRFALDNSHGHIYFTVPSTASLVSAPLPAGVF
jgi:6-bladed beta-propeller protein